VIVATVVRRWREHPAATFAANVASRGDAHCAHCVAYGRRDRPRWSPRPSPVGGWSSRPSSGGGREHPAATLAAITASRSRPRR